MFSTSARREGCRDCPENHDGSFHYGPTAGVGYARFASGSVSRRGAAAAIARARSASVHDFGIFGLVVAGRTVSAAAASESS